MYLLNDQFHFQWFLNWRGGGAPQRNITLFLLFDWLLAMECLLSLILSHFFSQKIKMSYFASHRRIRIELFVFGRIFFYRFFYIFFLFNVFALQYILYECLTYLTFQWIRFFFSFPPNLNGVSRTEIVWMAE